MSLFSLKSYTLQKNIVNYLSSNLDQGEVYNIMC